MISSPAVPPVPIPPAPPSPPIITSNAPNARVPGSQVNPLVGFDATLAGGTPQGQGNQTPNLGKTFLGQ